MKELVEIDGAGTALPELPELPEGELPELPQAAMIKAALPASAVRPTLLVTVNNETTSLVGGTCQDMLGNGNTKPPSVNESVNIHAAL